MVEGLLRGITNMKLGEKSDILIQPQFGYGGKRSPQRPAGVPAAAILMYSVELI